jgi:putative AdoMet-dependent methyltransferase
VTTDHFADRAAGWEQVSQRVENVENIAREMHRRLQFDASMEIMDFGSGTGLLLERIAPSVRKITAVDTSPAMNEQLDGKRDALDCELEIIERDLTREDVGGGFDGIISSMTIHHVEDIPALFRIFHKLLKPGGFVAIADLETEDGSFHEDDTGVHHFGFDPDAFLQTVQEAGFENPQISTANVIRRPECDYPVFLLTARR